MNKERLMLTAELLDSYSESHPLRFDLEGWRSAEAARATGLWRKPAAGSSAVCAIGLVCHAAIFAAQGFHYRRHVDGNITPAFGTFEGWAAVKAFFDLNQSEVGSLFGAHSYTIKTGKAAASAVADRIRSSLSSAA